MSNDNAKYAKDGVELTAMNLLDAVAGHELVKSGRAGGVLVSEPLYMCLEVFKRENGGLAVDEVVNSLHGAPLAVLRDYEPSEWYILDREEWLGAIIDGDLEYFEVEVSE